MLGDKYLQDIREGAGLPDDMDLDGSIEFNKDNYTGELGKVFLNGDTFTIEGIDGMFTLTYEDEDLIVTGTDDVEYSGFKELCAYGHRYSFIVGSILRSDDTYPQVAFAKVMYNL